MVLEKSFLEKKKVVESPLSFLRFIIHSLNEKPTGRGAPAEGISHIDDALIDHIFSQVDLL